VTSAYDTARDRLRQLDDRWRDLPLRTRLTSAAVLAATITVVAVVSVAYVAVRHELRGQVDKDRRQQVADAGLVAYYELGQLRMTYTSRIDEPSAYIQVFDADGQTATVGGPTLVPVADHDRTVLSDGRIWTRDATINSTHVRLLTTRTRRPGVGVMAALPLVGVDHQLHTLRIAFFFLVLAGLALTVLVA